MRYIFLIGILLLVCTQSFITPREFEIKGTVTDASNGRPLQGVQVMIKGDRSGTATQQDGSFSIRITAEKATLVFTYVGYERQEVKVTKDSKPLQVKMNASVAHLQEVVVVGPATQKKSDITCCLIPTEQSINNALSGRVAGVTVQKGKRRGQPHPQNTGNDWRYNNNFEREGYESITENRFLKVTDNPLSTFSIDVDAASYSNVRRMLNMGQLPPAGAVRIEEMINYFKYDYPQPEGNDPFSINTEMADCPWNNQHRLIMVGLQGKQIPVDNLPAGNLVFLIDVSGSMMSEDKLPLVQKSMKLLTDQLREQDHVAIVVYAGNAGLVLPSTSGAHKQQIKDAIDKLQAGGSTAGGAGIKLAYKVARDHFKAEGNNRVILCTDGDFNVGASSDAALEQMIEQERESGVFLTVLGFGTGNYQDAKMQKLADKGNGNHGYIDNFSEARKVLVNEFGGTLFTIAKDVKLQIEFNPAKVQAYRLIGYENRMLNKEDFNNDKKDAGDLGSGHTVTALYEVIPAGIKSKFLENVDKLKYQSEYKPTKASDGQEIMTIKFRYKNPKESKSKLIEHAVTDQSMDLAGTSENFRFAAAVAQFGMLLLNSEFKQSSSFSNAWQLAKGSLGQDREGYRSELLKLIKSAQSLAGQKEKEVISSK